MTRGRERGTAPILSHGQTTNGQCGFNQAASTQPTPSSAIEHAENAVTRRQCSTQLSAGALDLLENGIDPERTLDAHDPTVLSRFWLEFGFWRDLEHGEIIRRFGLNIFDTG